MNTPISTSSTTPRALCAWASHWWPSRPQPQRRRLRLAGQAEHAARARRQLVPLDQERAAASARTPAMTALAATGSTPPTPGDARHPSAQDYYVGDGTEAARRSRTTPPGGFSAGRRRDPNVAALDLGGYDQVDLVARLAENRTAPSSAPRAAHDDISATSP